MPLCNNIIKVLYTQLWHMISWFMTKQLSTLLSSYYTRFLKNLVDRQLLSSIRLLICKVICLKVKELRSTFNSFFHMKATSSLHSILLMTWIQNPTNFEYFFTLSFTLRKIRIWHFFTKWWSSQTIKWFSSTQQF